MARLPYVMESPDPPPDVRCIYADIVKLRGGIVNLYRVLANQPPALRAFMTMSRYVREGSLLPPQLRELAILVTACIIDVEYELVHHIAAARKVGVSEAKLRDVATWRNSAAYDPAERAVMAYAEEVARSRTIDDSTFTAVLEHLSRQQVVDLVVTVAWYHFVAVVLLTLHVDLEPPQVPS